MMNREQHAKVSFHSRVIFFHFRAFPLGSPIRHTSVGMTIYAQTKVKICWLWWVDPPNSHCNPMAHDQYSNISVCYNTDPEATNPAGWAKCWQNHYNVFISLTNRNWTWIDNVSQCFPLLSTPILKNPGQVIYSADFLRQRLGLGGTFSISPCPASCSETSSILLGRFDLDLGLAAAPFLAAAVFALAFGVVFGGTPCFSSCWDLLAFKISFLHCLVWKQHHIRTKVDTPYIHKQLWVTYV